MNRLISFLVILSHITLCYAQSGKRGVCENEFRTETQLEILSPGVGWYYNWGNTENGNVNGQEVMEFVPMCWNRSYDANAIRDYCKSHPATKYLLGFNEPNHKGQANLTPAEAAEAWPKVQELAKELNLQLVAPALNYSPDYPYYEPQKWMDEFVDLVGSDAFDFTAIHSYGGAGLVSYLSEDFYKRYGKPVWLTEFCLWEGDHTPEQQISDMMKSIEWLEKSDCVYRYAWFKPIGDSSSAHGPNYGLLKGGVSGWKLSEQGKVYAFMSDFNKERYHKTGQQIPSSEYISSDKILLGSLDDNDNDTPIGICKLRSGGFADYQIETEEAGDYTLSFRASNSNMENPSITVILLDEAGRVKSVLLEPFEIEAGGSGFSSVEIDKILTLNKGKQTIRIKEAKGKDWEFLFSSFSINPANSSSASSLSESKDAKVNVYNINGVLVKKNVYSDKALEDVNPGVYIVGDKKMRK